MKKYTAKSTKPTMIVSTVLIVLMIAAVVLLFVFDKKEFAIPFAIIFGVIIFFCIFGMIVGLRSYILMDDEKIIFPREGELKYDAIRSVSIRFIHEDNVNTANSVLLSVFFFVISLLVQEDCMPVLSSGARNRFECIFHMKDGNDLKISLQDYGMEQSREIVETLESKISRCFHL